jgi:hypothetical protein
VRVNALGHFSFWTLFFLFCLLAVSFRDPECARTLLDLFLSAEDPNRITVGLVEQVPLPPHLSPPPLSVSLSTSLSLSLSLSLSRARALSLSLQVFFRLSDSASSHMCTVTHIYIHTYILHMSCYTLIDLYLPRTHALVVPCCPLPPSASLPLPSPLPLPLPPSLSLSLQHELEDGREGDCVFILKLLHPHLLLNVRRISMRVSHASNASYTLYTYIRPGPMRVPHTHCILI